MKTNSTVSVVVPTIGRASLSGAVESALAQSIPIHEVLVVADTVEPLLLPDDSRIRVVRTGPQSGSANARQSGIDASTGEVIALLDDDDLWHPFKLERQLAEVADINHENWVVACKCAVRQSGRRERIWPRTLIGERQPVEEYLFRLDGFALTRGMGNGMLQSSTLCFPRGLAVDLPVNHAPGAVHDEPGWLMRLQQQRPNLVIRQVSECFSIYNVTDNSVSRQDSDDSERYIAWGREHLLQSSARVRGDYFLTSAVTAAASAASLNGIRRAAAVGLTEGRPGPSAILYAAAKFGKTAIDQLLNSRRVETPR